MEASLGRARLTLEPARPGDGDAIVALWAATGLTRPWNDPRSDLARALAGPGSTVLVARADATIVGTVMVGHDGHRGWIYYLAVDPGRRRDGLGRALMAAAEAWLRAADAPKAQLMVRRENAGVVGFYAALGYDEQDVVVLGRRLDPAGPATPSAAAADPADPADPAAGAGRLGPADAGELLTLQRAAFVVAAIDHGEPRLPPLLQTLDELRAVLADPAVTVLGVRAAGRLVASVRWHVDAVDPTVAHVGRLVVAPDAEGAGLGSGLMRAVEAAARSVPGVRELRLFTGEHSRQPLALYARLGYVESERTRVGSYDLVHLVRRLTAAGDGQA